MTDDAPTARERLQRDFYALVQEGQRLVAELRKTRDPAVRARLAELSARKKALIARLKDEP